MSKDIFQKVTIFLNDMNPKTQIFLKIEENGILNLQKLLIGFNTLQWYSYYSNHLQSRMSQLINYAG